MTQKEFANRGWYQFHADRTFGKDADSLELYAHSVIANAPNWVTEETRQRFIKFVNRRLEAVPYNFFK